MNNVQMLPRYDTKLFTEIWEDKDAFLSDYNGATAVGIPSTISSANATILYYLLYSKFGNSPIANYDEEQFKYKVFSIIWQYGPTWEKRLAVQASVRNLSDADIQLGAKAIYNTALNPSTTPSTGSLDELTYINQQNTTNYKKSKLEAYGILWEMLKTDVTEEFLNKFKKLFKQFVRPERTWIYVTEEEDEESDE